MYKLHSMVETLALFVQGPKILYTNKYKNVQLFMK